nr:MAG TPA: hypothetical protein [Caudoviricetes sp.]
MGIGRYKGMFYSFFYSRLMQLDARITVVCV